MQGYCGSCWNPVKQQRASAKSVLVAAAIWRRSQSIEKLLRTTKHADAQTVRRAVWILCELGTPDAVAQLEALLDRVPISTSCSPSSIPPSDSATARNRSLKGWRCIVARSSASTRSER